MTVGLQVMSNYGGATDSNLKRAVAIKVLPAAVAADGDRLARFQREAEVRAALNHPNGAHNHTISTTITSPAMMTGAGVILGTAPYMAPWPKRAP